MLRAALGFALLLRCASVNVPSNFASQLARYGLVPTGVATCDEVLAYYLRCAPALDDWQGPDRGEPLAVPKLVSGPQSEDWESLTSRCGSMLAAYEKGWSPICNAPQPDPLRQRCHETLRRRHQATLRKATSKVFIDLPGGVEFEATLPSGAGAPREGGRCQFRYMQVPDGFLHLPRGWLAVDGNGDDTRVGEVIDERDRVRMKYDIGQLAGAYVESDEENAQALPPIREERVNGGRLRYRLGKRFTATLSDCTNFWVNLQNQEIGDELLGVMRSLRPRR